MTAAQLVRQRLRNQKLTHSTLRTPDAVVSWLGAVQAQDYAGAKWALGRRAIGVSDADVEAAFTTGAILRTHVLRPTWHFVAPRDIRWLLALSGPRVHAVNGSYYRKFELDARVLSRSRAVLERALRDRQERARTELAAILRRAGIVADGLRLAYLMMHAELDAVICSGARQGLQFTYALLEERVPPVPALDRDEALATLTRRYFTSHGPATIRDFVWWSGLTVRDAKAGIAAAALVEGRVHDRACWFAEPGTTNRPAPRAACLLPNYDEFGIAYKDRDVVASAPWPSHLAAADEFAHLLTIDGELIGRWRRTVTAAAVLVEAQLFRPLHADEQRALAREVARHGRFMNLPATLVCV